MFKESLRFFTFFIVSLSFVFCTKTDEDNNDTNDDDDIPVVIDNSPGANFDLSNWKLSVPVDRGDGIATDVSVYELNNGYEDEDYFYMSDDGGMVFKCPISGPKTSANTSYTRTELREMLRGTNTGISTQGVNGNNWVFGSAPQADIDAAGGYDGLLEATLAVNHVTTTGNSSQVGRVIIGQIHANDNEPCRLYYRKLPGHTKGSIYAAHEPAEGYGDEVYDAIIGSRSSSADEPEDGIALNEKFSYKIEVQDHYLRVVIQREGKEDVSSGALNMENSGYTSGGKYQYFKAGVYNQNNTGDADDYVQATFYALKQSHK